MRLTKTTMDSVSLFDVFDNSVLRWEIAVAILTVGHVVFRFDLLLLSTEMEDQGRSVMLTCLSAV